MAHTWGSRVPFTLLLLGALAQPAHAAPSAAPPGGFATDRIVVRLKAEAKSGRAADALSARAGERLERVRTTGDGREVLRLGRRVDAAQFAALARRLAADPAVADVLPDRVFFPSLLPDDPQYGSQWALFEAHGVGAPAAWDRTTGSAGVTVAIVDTGKLEHPDLAGRWLPGHDFVGDANRSSDGGGRDGDATDTGDWVTAAEAASGPLSGCPVTESRWHGLAMAGLIAATGNNALGVAGLDWNAKLLPVRAVGKCGGYESDIADGIRWAAGYPVPGVPANASPAKVVNVSLESAGTCSTLTQGAIDDALAVGATVVASAGNNGASVANFSPANCDGVIAVGATNRLGRLPSYANTGAAIALSAPGGEGSGPDALLTTFDTGTTAPALSGTWAAVNGTSASAALVSGIVSLLYARNPALVAQQVRHLLLATAKPFPSDAVGGQVNCNTANCGVGIADALATRYATAPGPGGPIAQAVAPATAAVAAMALRSDGRVFTIGRSPVERAEVTGARRLAMSAGQALALKADGTVVEIAAAVTPVAGLERIVAIDAGARQVNEPWALALRADGTLFAWGNNGYGKLADGTETSRTTVAAVPLAGVSAMAAGATHALAIVDGEVWAWGSNEVGELGIGAVSPNTCATAAGGSAPCAKAPVKVPGLAGVVFVAAGSRTSFAVLADGTVRAWGNNGSGQLGDGTTTNRDSPVVVAGLSGVKAVSAGDDHAFAVTQGGDLFAWGGNGFAQLLTGGAGAAIATPFLVTTVGKVAAARAGAGVSLVTGVDGRLHSAGLYAPGYNVDYGPGSFIPQPGAVFVIDRYPAAFVAEAEVTAFGTLFESNAITAAAIPTGSVVTIAGGEYAIDGGAWTAAPGTIGPGQSVRVRAQSGACGTTVTATLTIAGVAREYRIASAACDTVPDALGWLTAQAHVAPGAAVVSNTVTVSGINTPVAVSVSSAL
ncbi:MAG TPA: S8 family serine peptidase, partial [Usitatibacteraceae bacterium]|nr:S8 family serine peptidase [Usitatibacteraceae bacterium]